MREPLDVEERPAGGEERGEQSSLLHGDLSAPWPSRWESLRMLTICLSMCLYGMQHAALGAAILDLTVYFRSSLAVLSAIMSSQGVAMAAASIVLTVYVDKWRHLLDRALPACTLLVSLLLVLPSVCGRSVALFGVCQLLAEVVWTVILLAMITVTTGVWGRRTPFLMFLHKLFSGGGAALAVPLAVPFLSFHPAHRGLNVTSPNYTAAYSDADTPCRAHLIYILLGVFGVVPLALYCGVLYKVRYIDYVADVTADQATKSFFQYMSPRYWATGRETYGKYLAFFTVINTTCVYSVDIAIKTYLVAMVTRRSELDISKLRAEMMLDVYNVLEIAACALFAVVSLHCDVIRLVIAQFTLMANAMLLLAVAGLTHRTVLWVAVCGLAVSVGPCYASFMGWTNQYIVLSGFSMSFVNMGRGLGWFLGEGAGGQLLERGPDVVIYFLLGVVLVSVHLYIPTQVWSSRLGKRSPVIDTDL